MSRPDLLLALALLLTGCPRAARSTAAPFKPLPPNQTLRTYAQKAGVHMGTAVGASQLGTDAQYQTTLADQYDLVTAENELKWKATEPSQGDYHFTAADQILTFAKAHGQIVRGHNLVWHTSVPDWVKALSGADRRAALQKHIATVVGHVRTSFPGLVPYWDVVNEAMGDTGVLRADSPWAAIDPDPAAYLALAFGWAHDADPDAELFYNDYNAERSGDNKSDAVYALVKQLKAAGVPIGGVGLQMHVRVDTPPNLDDVKANMQRLVALGLHVHITEMDVALQMPATDDDIQAQGKLYGDLLGICLSVPGCTAFVTWGFTDKYSWIPDFFPGFGAALPFGDSFQQKPAFGALLSHLMR